MCRRMAIGRDEPQLTKLPEIIQSLQPEEMEPGEGEKTCVKVLKSCVAGEVVWEGGS